MTSTTRPRRACPGRAVGRDRISDAWDGLGGMLRRRWRKLKWQDVLVPDGDSEYLATLLQERYGLTRRDALVQVYEFEYGLSVDQDGGASSVRRSLDAVRRNIGKRA